MSDAADSGVTVSKNGLHAHRSLKTPLQKIHLKARLDYAKCNMKIDSSYWKRAIWSDDTKLELFGHRSVAFVMEE